MTKKKTTQGDVLNLQPPPSEIQNEIEKVMAMITRVRQQLTDIEARMATADDVQALRKDVEDMSGVMSGLVHDIANKN